MVDAGRDIGIGFKSVKIEVIATAQVAGEIGRPRQFAADRHRNAIELRIKRRDFRVQRRERSHQRKAVGHGPLEVYVEAINLGITHIFDKEQESNV